MSRAGETKPVIRVAETKSIQSKILITLDYHTSDGTFVVYYNGPMLTRVTRNGESDDAFIARAVSHYRDAVVVFLVTTAQSPDKEHAERATAGVLNAARIKAARVLEELRGAR